MKKKFILFSLLLCLGTVSLADSIILDDESRKEAEKILEARRKKILEEDKIRAKAQAEEEARRMLEEQARLEAQQQVEVVEEAVVVEGGEEALEAARARNNTIAGGSAISNEKLVDEYIKEKARLEKEEKKNLKTPMEKLEYTHKKALEKVDFYERVVRSVAREEQEVNSYKEILNMDM